MSILPHAAELLLGVAVAGIFGPVIAGVYLLVRLNRRQGRPSA